MTTLDDRLRRGYLQHGDKWDGTALLECDPSIIDAYESGKRVRVQNGDHIRTGTVGTTTGWRPAFLLMHRSNAISSWDVLGPKDKVVAVQHGRKYVEVTR